jgi:hypothetical protein
MAMIEVTRGWTPELGQCRGCGRAIEWVWTTAGKRMPVDAPLVAERVHERPGAAPITVIDSARSHFATCPNAHDFRRRR